MSSIRTIVSVYTNANKQLVSNVVRDIDVLLSDLGDIDLSGATSNDVLVWNGTAWVNNPSVIFIQTQKVTVANTTTPTDLVGTGKGSKTIPANYFIAGRTLRVYALGYHSAVSSPTIRVQIKLGSTTILDTGTVNSGNSTDSYIKIEGEITCITTGLSGTVRAQGFYLETGGGSNHFGMTNTSDVTLDTTSSQALSMIVTWGTANPSNSITVSNLTLETLTSYN